MSDAAYMSDPGPCDHIVIGSGAWGTALAVMLARAGNTVGLIARTEQRANEINAKRENTASLPGVTLPSSLTVHRDATKCLAASSNACVLLAMPAQANRQAVSAIAAVLRDSHTLIITAKGLERGTQKLLSTVVNEEAPGIPVAVLSGPSFAHDVGRGFPTAITLAALTLAQADGLCARLKGHAFRPYASDDMIGVQLGGALKNVLAIAAGAVEGKGLGQSAKVALITRGFAELSRLSISQGAKPETLVGLSGLGDLVLTCSTSGSRNFAFGYQMGQNILPDKLMREGQPLAEGAKTAAAALALGKAHDIDLPITQTVAATVEGAMSVDDAIDALMSRPLKREHQK